jgi:ribonuclease HI
VGSGDLISIYIDGASRGNPGLSGIGVVIVKDRSKIKEITEFVGTKTNNRAEYLALKKALEVAIEIDDEVTVFSDSKLVVQQRNRQYKIRNRELKILAREISNLERKYKVIIYKHIPRQENRLADLLANRAIEDELNISNSSLRSDGSDDDSELT